MAFFDFLNGYMPDTNAPYYTQDYVPIKNIYGGVIHTKDERFLRIVEVLPVNFESKSVAERDDIIHEFGGWLSVAPVNIQIKIITEESDPKKIIDKVKARYEQDKDEKIEYLMKHYTELLATLGSKGAVSKRFYLVVSYEPKAYSKKRPSLEEIVFELNEQLDTISSYFEKMGNLLSPLSDTGNPEDEQFAVLEFLYRLYNPRTSRNEPGKPAVELQTRIDRLFKDKRKVTNDPEALVAIEDVLAPINIDVTRKDAVMFDGLYHTYVLVASEGYPINVFAGWFSNLFSLGPGENLDMFIHREPINDFRRYLTSNLRESLLNAGEGTIMSKDYETSERALDSAAYIKQALAQDEAPFFLTTLITLTGYTYEDLIKRKNYVIEYFSSRNIKILPLDNIQEESMRSSFPFLDLSPKLYAKGRRNVLTSGLASCYPFISATMYDEGGVLMGLDMVNNTMCILNPYNRAAYKNANMVILGTSGSGKSYTEQLMALRMRLEGVQCFILAPDKAHEFHRACTTGVGGEFITISGASPDHINIMDIRPMTSEAAEVLQSESVRNASLVADKADAIITFISLLVPELTNEEMQIIDNCILKVYEKYGITEDNNSIYKDPFHKEKGLKQMPILGDLYNELDNSGMSIKVMRILSQFVTGTAKSFNNRTNVDLSNKYIVFDLSSLNKNHLPAGMYLALDFIVNRIREDVTERKMVFIDEGWQLIGSGANEKAAEYVKWLFKIIRGYNGGACIATQDINDFFSLNDGEYGGAILANSQIKMILNLSADETNIIKDQVNLTREEMRTIRNFGKGQCLICANANHIPVRVIGSQYEHKLITTDPDEVEQIVKEIRANNGKLL